MYEELINYGVSAIWSHLPKKSLMENFIFCAVLLIIDGSV